MRPGDQTFLRQRAAEYRRMHRFYTDLSETADEESTWRLLRQAKSYQRRYVATIAKLKRRVDGAGA